MSFKRIWLVAKLDLMKRVRSTRWVVALIAWALALLFVMATLYFVFNPIFSVAPSPGRSFWLSAASLILFFTLGIGMIVSGTTASAAINGERNDATLALLQVTPVRGAEIVLGKILAAWLSSLTLLLIATPFVLFVAASETATIPAFLLGILVTAIMLLVSTCIGIALSTLTPRPAGAATISFLLLAFFFVGTPMALGIASQLSEEHVPYTSHFCYEAWYDQNGHEAYPEDPEDKNPEGLTWKRNCEEVNSERVITHSDRYWWFLLANPAVALGDALPTTTLGWDTPKEAEYHGSNSPTVDEIMPNYWISGGMHTLRQPYFDFAIVDDKTGEEILPQYGHQPPKHFQGGRVWPMSLAFFVVLGVAGAALAISRSSVPIGKLPRGTRVA